MAPCAPRHKSKARLMGNDADSSERALLQLRQCRTDNRTARGKRAAAKGRSKASTALKKGWRLKGHGEKAKKGDGPARGGRQASREEKGEDKPGKTSPAARPGGGGEETRGQRRPARGGKENTTAQPAGARRPQEGEPANQPGPPAKPRGAEPQGPRGNALREKRSPQQRWQQARRRGWPQPR